MRSAFVKGLKVESASAGFDCAIVIIVALYLSIVMVVRRLRSCRFLQCRMF